MKDPQGLVWLNGALVAAEQATVSLVDPAIQSGVGAFETLAVREGQPLDWIAHVERLETTAEQLGFHPPGRNALRDGATAVASNVAGGLGWLKVMAVRGGPCAIFAAAIDRAEVGRAVSAVLLPWRRSPNDPLAHLKTLNYAAFTLGLEEARRRGADEGLWLNTRGHLAEGCSSSIFVVWKKKLFTPSVRDGILPGVTRSLVLDAARAMGRVTHEGRVRLKRLETADEAFLSSSVRGIRPLVRFQGRPVGAGKPGPITRGLAERVDGLRRVGFGDSVGSGEVHETQAVVPAPSEGE